MNNYIQNDAERIESIKCYIKTTYAELAKSLGVHANTLINMRTKGSKISSKMARKICDVYPEINFSWVMTGEGEMLKAANVARADNHSTAVVGNGNTIGRTASDQAIAELRQQVADKEQQLADLRGQLAVMGDQLAAKDEQLRAKDQQIASLLNIVANIQRTQQ